MADREKVILPVMAAGAFVGDTRGSNVRRAIKNGSTVKGYYARYAERGK